MKNRENTEKAKNICFETLIFAAIALSLIALSIYNLIISYSDFLKINIGSIITFTLAIVVTYLFNQKKSDERKKKDQIEKLLVKLQISLSSDYVVCIDNENSKKLNTIFQRFFDNRIDMLTKLDTNIVNKKSLQYIKERFKEYKLAIGNEIHDFEGLRDLETELTKYIQNIDYKIDEILLNIYK